MKLLRYMQNRLFKLRNAKPVMRYEMMKTEREERKLGIIKELHWN